MLSILSLQCLARSGAQTSGNSHFRMLGSALDPICRGGPQLQAATGPEAKVLQRLALVVVAVDWNLALSVDIHKGPLTTVVNLVKKDATSGSSHPMHHVLQGVVAIKAAC